MLRQVLIIAAFCVPCLFQNLSAHGEELRIPAFTAYMLPDPNSTRISEKHGVTRWTDAAQSVNWYGKFAETGELTAKVELQLAEGATSKLRLTIDGKSRESTVTGKGSDNIVADFGSFSVSATGYQRIQLESLNENGQPFGDIQTLILDGAAVKGVHFNLKERRNAASVHLMYPVPEGADVAAFYCEVTAIEDPTTTYYMACGWHRGYFGMQVNSPTERRIIFSVWDSGNEGVDRKKVDDANRVTLMGKGEGVYSGDFGNEGTGGHSHLKYMWKTGEKQYFIVTAEPTNKTQTVFSGYWLHPEDKKWMLISSWRAPKEGGRLRGLYSFSENFGGSNGHLLRKALYGNQWIRNPAGEWTELTTARFSHDATGKSDRLDRFMGVEDGEFFLSHGGFTKGFTEYGTAFDRPATGKAPQDTP
ncbi:MAG TPA: DUF3472 domain-containing protein [Planctomycetaceae bacterium]|nr:DUF3472 domain-containing protein [Planctomycetaceae bacterium]